MPGKNIKDLFSQLETVIKKDKKKTLIAVVCVFIILTGLIYIVKLNYNFIKQAQNDQTGQPSAATSGNGQPDSKTPSTLLPDLKRKIETGQEVRDPFNVALKLKGIINGGNGGDLAIIEAGNTSYVAKVGEEIKSGWKVKEIKKDVVILTADNQSLELKFNGQANIKTNNNQNTADPKQQLDGQGSDSN